MLEVMNNRVPLAAGVLMVGLVLTGCGSGGNSHTASPTSSPTSAASGTTAPPRSTATTAAVSAGLPTCPTMAQADAALGVSYSGPIRTPTEGGGIACEYTAAAGGGSAGVTIFAHETSAIFAGQIAHADEATGMQKIPGLGDGAYGLTTGGRSVVNAYSDQSRAVVAAQAPGALAPVEALPRVALADN